MADVDEPLFENADEETGLVNIEADEEEEGEQDTFPFDNNTFIRKLREKPRFPKEAEDCGTKEPQKSYKDFKASAANRLSCQTLSSLDQLRQLIPYPVGAIPPLALPSWHLLPIEKKIPMVQSPAGLFYYTRGKLGRKLHRKPVLYSLLDPLNQERVVGGPYTVLHDPHAKSLLYSPVKHTVLLERGFINESDEVLCTLREFNKFREYLKTLYCDQIWKEIENADAFWKTERDQTRALLRAESQDVGRDAKVSARIKAAKKFQQDSADFRRKKQQHLDKINEARLRQWHSEKQRSIIEHMMMSIEEARRAREKLQALYELRLQQRRDMLTKSFRKHLETVERQKSDKAMMQAAYNKFLLEWIQSKYVFCYEKMIERKQLQEDLRANQKYRAKKRQRRLEHYREQMPHIIEKRKEEAARILGIVRKFAMRWLEKVRRRLNAPKDVKHESCWIGQSKGVLDDTVKYLRAESGYEKLDDFILNIMKLKKQIQAQIELEEAEEAAAAAAAEEGDGAEEGAEEAEG